MVSLIKNKITSIKSHIGLKLVEQSEILLHGFFSGNNNNSNNIPKYFQSDVHIIKKLKA